MGAEVQYITIGKIVNTHGHRGEVRVIPLTDFPERFSAMDKALVELNGQIKLMNIEKTYPHKKFIIIKFAGINDMNTAETLKNARLLIPRDEQMPLPEDTFYVFDIVGMEVFTDDRRYLGQVQDVLQTGANDVFIVEGATKRPLLIPALKQVVRNVDMEQKEMTVCLPEGLEELS
ncbi:Ribosome maturation factor RimM [Sporotomaculum syntrophicum]|uniref:Ribosome maturation factor RimM n=1 Tax=Sporotomaculum syntrophicum TaxID=182264 RepID=A0A9D2WSN8_9FIRM|nr:ribosome maturation factor RimM [Sporotomaculum syntrophicum]KAF1086648.1 Ribosome maturation factor RimM [Sporotomaculum syntrophicum]